eukprot:3910478-Alexandrium_andersonii.AAC.1
MEQFLPPYADWQTGRLGNTAPLQLALCRRQEEGCYVTWLLQPCLMQQRVDMISLSNHGVP